MTIPMMPGWWDQIAPSVQSLGQTVLRATNPHFDNQVAALEFMRQNPANQQAMIDAAATNPQMIQQMLGQRMFQDIIGRGSPSFAAQTEIASRELASKPAGQVADTFVNRAAAARANVRTNEQLAEDVQRVRYYSMNNARTELENRALFPKLESQVREYDRIRTAIPNPGNINPEALAERYFNNISNPNTSQEDRQSVDDEYSAMIGANPDLERVFWGAVGILQGMQDAREAEGRQIRVERRQREREGVDNERWARQKAAELRIQHPEIPEEEAFRFILADPARPATGLAVRVLSRDAQFQQAQQRQARYTRFLTGLTGYARLDNKNSDAGLAAKSALDVDLSAFLGVPISIKSVDDPETWLSNKSVFVLGNGEEISGEWVQRMINNPYVGPTMMLSDAELDATIAELNARKDELSKIEFENNSSILLAEKQRRQERARASNRNTGRRGRASR